MLINIKITLIIRNYIANPLINITVVVKYIKDKIDNIQGAAKNTIQFPPYLRQNAIFHADISGFCRGDNMMSTF